MSALPEVGAYEVEGEIGRGAMGVVYGARDPRLERRVAIKVLAADVAADPARLARFEREARLLAGLAHPNVATVFGLERGGSGPFLVMELVEGETLAARVARGRLPVDEALAVCAQIAAGVEAAHERGVVHRDLKPGNVMLHADGAVKVLDFGLAREAAPEAGAATVPAGITREGIAVGTPGFMSPEQARGREVDRRTDIFALGCILFECLTGRPAFHGESAVETIAATLERDPDWTLLPERTPWRVRELLEECLAKDPRRRLRDIGDARLELERALERREWTTTGAMRAAPGRPRTWRGGLPWAVAGAALLGLGVAAWGPWRGGGGGTRAAARTPVRFVVNDEQFRHRRMYDVASLAISPDGSSVVFNSLDRDGQQTPAVRRLSEAGSTALTFAESQLAHNPAFSPDGRWVALARSGSLLKISIGGGHPVTLYRGEGLTKGHCWTERGIILSPRLNGGLVLIDADGGTPIELTAPDAARGEVSHRWPDALPGGRQVLFTVKKQDTPTFDEASIALLDVESGRWRTVIEGGMFARYAPTGHIVYARAGALLAVPFDAGAGRVTGAPVLLLRGLATEPGSGAAQFAIARDAGTLVYVAGAPHEPRYEMVWIDLDGTMTPVGAPLRNYVNAGVSISPDGTRVATGVFGATDSIFVYDFARGISTRLTSRGNCGYPFWSRDGTRIAFISDCDGPSATYIASADGTGVMERLTDDHPGNEATFAALDGREAIVYERGQDLWVHPLPGGPARAIVASPFHERSPRVSPDQRWLAYTSDETGQSEVYVRPFPEGEGKRQVSIGGGGLPWWLHGSDGVVYRGRDGSLYVSRLEGEAFARPQVLMPHPEGLHSLEMLPDGSRFLGLRAMAAPPETGRVDAVLHWFEELKAAAPVGAGGAGGM